MTEKDVANVIFRKLERQEIDPALLQNFDRYQETTRVWYEDNGELKVRNDRFTESWDDRKKEQVARSLQQCAASGGVVIGAFLGGALVGFANVESGLFGRSREYAELPYLHVSRPHRGLGIGRRLFELCRLHAKRLGASKLYIGAHPSAETQRFYRSAGCVPAKEINPEIYVREPLDIQLETAL